MVNSSHGPTYCLRYIFAQTAWKSPFSPTVLWGTFSNVNVIYTSLKSTFRPALFFSFSLFVEIFEQIKMNEWMNEWMNRPKGLQFCRWQCRSIFIRLAIIASQICEITRNFQKIWTYSSSMTSKVNRSSILVLIESVCATSY